MAIVSIPADFSKGADPSPWTVNGDDLYTDSTSYLVGIGNTNPDTALHVTAASAAQIKLEDGEASNNNPVTIRKYKDGGTHTVLFQSENGAASGNSVLDFLFKNDRTGGGGSTIRVIGGSNSGLYLTDGAQGLKIDQNTANRRVRFRDFGAGNAGGCFNMEYNDSGSGTAQNYFSFGYGDEAHPYDARLNIKDAALPQLALTDGTDTATIKTSNSDLTVGHNDASWNFTLNATTNTNLAFAKGGTIKAAIRHYGATEGLFGVQQGLWRNNITPASAASQTVSAQNGYGNVIAMDTTSNAITATLPAVADYSGTVFYVIDSKGNAGAVGRAITIAVQTGEKLDGVTNGTATISSNNGFSVLVCTADGWFQVG